MRGWLSNMLRDIYVLVPKRTRGYVDKFLTKWATSFGEVADEYVLPQYSMQPEARFQDVNLLIEQLVNKPNELYGIYWINPERNEDIVSAMLFFTIDGELIVGISTKHSRAVDLFELLIKILDDVDGRLGAVFFEQPPPDSANEFITLVRNSDLKIIRN